MNEDTRRLDFLEKNQYTLDCEGGLWTVDHDGNIMSFSRTPRGAIDAIINVEKSERERV